MTTAFAGIIYPDVLQVSDLIDEMLAVLQHRASGTRFVHLFKNFQLGCLGTSFALSAKKTQLLFFDGWLENGMSLLRELSQQEGVLTDSEIILLAYQKWGIQFLNRLNGDFALMLLDQEESTILLARDPIGKRSLYWYHDKHYLIFGSELKALLATGIVPQTPSPGSLASYFFFGFSPQDLTPIKDVNKLLPAHYLLYSHQHGKQILPYWSYSSYFAKRTHTHKSQIVSHIHLLLEKSVEARIPKQGPLGSIVSGGLGSATIAYYLKRYSQGHPIKAFTAGFRGQSEEDIAATQMVCKSLHLQQEIQEVTPTQFLDEYPRIVWFLDEPIADPNVLATWKLAESSATFTNTVYSGMGSDELLAGHSRYTLAERNVSQVNRLSLLPDTILRKVLIPFARFFYPSAAFALLKGYRTLPWQFEYLRHTAFFDEHLLNEASPKLSGLFNPETFLNKFHHLSRIHSHVSTFLYFDVKTRLPDAFILQYERLTRAFKLLWQTPFLDRELLEYAASLPEPESLRESETASYLKPLVQGVFPDEFLNRPKKTRKYFLSSWTDHQDIAEVFQLLLKGTLVGTGIISERWLAEQLSSSEQMRQCFPQLFAILTLEVWFRIFVNRTITPSPPRIRLKELLQEY